MLRIFYAPYLSPQYFQSNGLQVGFKILVWAQGFMAAIREYETIEMLAKTHYACIKHIDKRKLKFDDTYMN